MSHDPRKILCLADDLTGLAEVAGQIANLNVQSTLFVEPRGLLEREAPPQEGVVFVNLGCRSFSEAAAKKEILGALAAFRGEKPPRVYLKVDSAARGPIASLLEGIFEALGPTMVPLLLANPGQGRFTRMGTVTIEGQLLHETSFRHDPIHPRACSFLPEILGRSSGQQMNVLSNPGDGPESGVCVLDADSERDVQLWADHFHKCSVAAGAAPFGVQLLRHWIDEPFETQREFPRIEMDTSLFVIGTRHSSARRLVSDLTRSGCAILDCEGGTATPSLPLAIIPPEVERNPDTVLRTLIESAVRIIDLQRPETVFVTGGETAQALLRKLGLTSLRPISYHRQLALLATPQSARSRCPSFLVLKPGSYYKEDMVDGIFAASLSRSAGQGRVESLPSSASKGAQS